MSELIQKNDNRATIRWKLMTGASALALAAYVSSASVARAEDTDRPLLWIELGGQLEMMQGLSSTFTAPFMTAVSPLPAAYGSSIFSKGQEPPRFAFGADGKITFQPEDSDWIFSASVRYGRSHAHRHIHQQSPSAQGLGGVNHNQVVNLYAAVFVDVAEPYSENHTVVDFSAGKDVGIGAFGPHGRSSIAAGVRFAQFAIDSALDIQARPSVGYVNSAFLLHLPHAKFYDYALQAGETRRFQGVGPSLTWNASAVLAGNPEHTELMLDWGVDGAMLFGRQRAKTQHATNAYHYSANAAKGHRYVLIYGFASHSHHSTRSRRVTVPDLDAFAAVSFKLPHSKISLGYRSDIWFGANDRGIDARKNSNLTFNGPYASISIGLGD